jgi:hypothetical protein
LPQGWGVVQGGAEDNREPAAAQVPVRPWDQHPAGPEEQVVRPWGLTRSFFDEKSQKSHRLLTIKKIQKRIPLMKLRKVSNNQLLFKITETKEFLLSSVFKELNSLEDDYVESWSLANSSLENAYLNVVAEYSGEGSSQESGNKASFATFVNN